MPPPDGAARRLDLHGLIRQRLESLDHRDDPDVARLCAAIRQRYGQNVAAVLLYGSYLRGKRDTLLDFYVLLDDLHGALPALQAWGNRLLPPNVYYLSLPEGAGRPALRAKYATLSALQFRRAMGDFHSYFWSRFTQPAGLVYSRDEAATRRVVDAMAEAARRFLQEAAPMLEPPFSAEAFWQRAFALTYGSELRAENPAGGAELYRHDRPHLDALLRACAESPGSAVQRLGATYQLRDPAGRWPPAWRWRLRALQGKGLSVLRLVKAAGTFDDPLDYLLWKIERHSGVYIAPTERQRRHPLIFAWPLLWRLYRRGAFR